MGLRLAVFVAPVAILAFCNESRTDERPATGSSASTVPSAQPALAPADEAKRLLHDRCVMCHGQDGRGDGPSAATLSPKPRDWTGAEWQRSATDAEIRNAILGGGVAVGKSPLMPPNPDLKDKPAVTDELVKLVRGYGKSK
jgi:cytochrome c551/c552